MVASATNSLNVMSSQFALAYSIHKQNKATLSSAHSAQAADSVIEKSPLKGIPGLGNISIGKLLELGISDLKSLREAPKETLKKVLNPISLKQVTEYLKKNPVETVTE